jgi:glycosyltransferase involved in cell wall biosynthesis
MNIAIVNHSEPGTKHISGMRAWFFAKELAKMGSRVVEICQAPRDCGRERPHFVGRSLSCHDWRDPLVLSVPQLHDRVSDLIRSGRTPKLLRKGLVAYSFGVRGGVYSDFSHALGPYLPLLNRDFRPDVVWGIFLNSDCWLVAQRLARMAGCPWVGDMKDSWEAFIPAPLRGLLARRFRDMAACTANSEFNSRVLERRFGRTPAVVYSGVDAAFAADEPALHEPRSGEFRLTLMGSLYTESTIDQFVCAVRRWVADEARRGSSGNSVIEIVYAGTDSVRAEAKLGSLRDLARVQVHGYLPLPELAALCRSATANAYMWCPTTFHHKLLELLSCGRPVIAFPGETDESRRLAARCGGDLRCPSNELELVSVLEDVRLRGTDGKGVRPVIDDFTWAAQARILESVFEKVVTEHRR